MFFKEKREAIMKASLNKNRSEEDKIEDLEEIDLDKVKEESKLDLETGDMLALILGGFITFAPVFLVLFLILIWAYKGMS